MTLSRIVSSNQIIKIKKAHCSFEPNIRKLPFTANYALKRHARVCPVCHTSVELARLNKNTIPLKQRHLSIRKFNPTYNILELFKEDRKSSIGSSLFDLCTDGPATGVSDFFLPPRKSFRTDSAGLELSESVEARTGFFVAGGLSSPSPSSKSSLSNRPVSSMFFFLESLQKLAFEFFSKLLVLLL